jgi:hypothetical protein
MLAVPIGLPPMPPRKHKFAAAAPSERRVRTAGNFAQTSMAGKTPLVAQNRELFSSCVIAQWQSDANSKEIDKWKI